MGFKSRDAVIKAERPAKAVGFEAIYQRAARRKGGPDELEALLPVPKSRSQLVRMSDDRFLSAIAKNIFRAGFVWKIVDNKWSGFEQAFHGFAVLPVACLDEQEIDELAKDKQIIRNRQKIAAVRDNARFVLEVGESCGSFGRYLADWPEDDLVGLWEDLHRRGSRLGGFTRSVFLRDVGKDTFMFTTDVVRALVAAGIVDKAPSSKRDIRAVQAAFNSWRAETGRPFCQLSRILAYSVG